MVGDFLFVTKERNGQRDLFISMSGERFVEALFPFSAEKGLSHVDYHIIDVTDEGQVSWLRSETFGYLTLFPSKASFFISYGLEFTNILGDKMLSKMPLL